MKKRIFAGALALLMIIGLLPVSSMFKKPMEVRAAVLKVLDFSDYNLDKKEGLPTTVTDFTLYPHKSAGQSVTDTIDNEEIKAYEFGGKLSASNGVVSSAIKFSINTNSKAVVIANCRNTQTKANAIGIYKLVNGNVELVASVSENASENSYSDKLLEIYNDSDTTTDYYIGFVNAKGRIHSLSVQEYDYKVAISDNGTDKTEYLNEGELVKLNASGSGDFAYWINSNGVIVGTERTLEIPAYYDVTYTAVYNTAAKVDYLTSYGSVYKSFTLDELTEEPVGPTCYGYEFANWDMSLEDIKTKLNNNENVVVKPEYKSASNEYIITVDTTDLGGSRVTSTYGINTIVTATTSSNEFAYWVDASNNNNTVLSYSSTYLFFANKDIEVKAVKGASGKDDNAKAVITNVSKKTVDNTNVAIFEYNIPADYQITFAGVVASKTLTGDNLTAENNGAHVIGDRNLSYTTYRYTLSATKGTTWHVRPMMKYTYGGTTYTIYGQEITME